MPNLMLLAKKSQIQRIPRKYKIPPPACVQRESQLQQSQKHASADVDNLPAMFHWRASIGLTAASSDLFLRGFTRWHMARAGSNRSLRGWHHRISAIPARQRCASGPNKTSFSGSRAVNAWTQKIRASANPVFLIKHCRQ